MKTTKINYAKFELDPIAKFSTRKVDLTIGETRIEKKIIDLFNTEYETKDGIKRPSIGYRVNAEKIKDAVNVEIYKTSKGSFNVKDLLSDGTLQKILNRIEFEGTFKDFTIAYQLESNGKLFLSAIEKLNIKFDETKKEKKIETFETLTKKMMDKSSSGLEKKALESALEAYRAVLQEAAKVSA